MGTGPGKLGMDFRRDQPMAMSQGRNEASRISVNQNATSVTIGRQEQICEVIAVNLKRLQNLGDRMFGSRDSNENGAQAPVGPGQFGQIEHNFIMALALLSQVASEIDRLEQL